MMRPKPANRTKHTAEEYEQLGRMLVNIYESGYLDRTETYKTNFLKGVVSGIGGVLGATIGIAILLWILSLFGHVPLVGRFVDNVKNTVQNSPQSSK